jgi:hypothetical protein
MKFSRSPEPSPPGRAPRTTFLFNGPGGRLIICETREIDADLLELRLEYAGEVLAHVFSGPDREERAATAADEMRQWFREHGYTEADADIPAIWADIRLVIPLAMLVYALWRMFTSAGR